MFLHIVFLNPHTAPPEQRGCVPPVRGDQRAQLIAEPRQLCFCFSDNERMHGNEGREASPALWGSRRGWRERSPARWGGWRHLGLARQAEGKGQAGGEGVGVGSPEEQVEKAGKLLVISTGDMCSFWWGCLAAVAGMGSLHPCH